MNDEPTAMKSPSDLVEELVGLVEQAIEITAQAVRQGLSDELNALTAAELVADPGFDY